MYTVQYLPYHRTQTVVRYHVQYLGFLPNRAQFKRLPNGQTQGDNPKKKTPGDNPKKKTPGDNSKKKTPGENPRRPGGPNTGQ